MLTYAALPKPKLVRPQGHPAGPEFGFEFVAMGSPCRLRLARLDEDRASALAQEVVAEVRRIEAKFSRYRADSMVSRINVSAGQGQAVAVDAETASLLNLAAKLHVGSHGRFDITSGVLRRVWNFRTGRVPTQAEIEAVLPCIGWDKVRWHESSRHIELTERGMELDFGGLGKEYAADRAATRLIDAGATSGFINLGGDIRVLGPQSDGLPWRMGIAHPRVEGAVIAGIDLSGGALATSGDYERSIERDGRRYCHILDPRTGWPVSYWRSVSVVAPGCLAAGALTTIAMLLEDQALGFLRGQGVGFLAIDQEGHITQEGV